MDKVRIRIANTLSVPRILAIEPWGSEVVLAPGQAVMVVSEGDLTSHMEIEIMEERLVVYSFSNAGALVDVFDEGGKLLN